ATNMTVIGQRLYFAQDDGKVGKELWVSDGTRAGTHLLKDIYPGSASSFLTRFVAFKGKLYFTATDGVHDYQLWMSDGTAAGTVPITNVSGGLFDNKLQVVGDKLLFFGPPPVGGTGEYVWRSDGTAADTAPVAPGGYPTTGSSEPYSSAVLGNVLLYPGGDSPYANYQLWRTDGTPAGTFRVSAFPTNTGGPNIGELTTAAGAVFFRASGIGGDELYKSDGTAAGTGLVKDIAGVSSHPEFLAEFKGKLYFGASDGAATGAEGEELWVSDGTNAGTYMFKAISPGQQGSFPRYFTQMGDVLYFQAFGPAGRELFRTDGTPDGTFQVKEIGVGSAQGDPSALTVVGSELFFSANDGTHGSELWETDGTGEGTRMVRDIWAGSNSSNPGGVALGDKLIFNAFEPNAGYAMWFAKDGPLADVGGPYAVAANQSMTLGGVADAGDGASIVSYEWDLDGDGIFGETGAAASRGDEVGATPTFSAAGLGAWTYPVSLRVTDSAGLASTASGGVAVTAAAGTTLPRVTGLSSRADADGTKVLLTFNQNVGDSLSPDDLSLVNLATPGAPPTIATTVAFDPNTHVATFDFAAPGGDGPLPDADYSLSLSAAGVYGDVGQNHLDGDADGTAGGDWAGSFSQLSGLTAEAGAAYTLTGPATAKVLNVTAGDITLTRDLSAGYPGVSLNVSGSATVYFAADQNFANVSLSGNGTISVGQPPPPPQSPGAGAAAGTPTPTPTPSPTPSGQPLVLTAQSAAFVRDGAYANTAFAFDPSLVVKKGPAGYTRETFLSFDVSQIGVIHSAKLRLFGRLNQSAGRGVAVNVYAAGGALPKGRLTWNHRPTAGAAAPASATVASIGGRWYEWDVGELLRAARAAGARTVTLALKGAAATNAAALFDGGRTGANGPRLILA
ncbi:MAG TPA: ELWxxDGT repeat protein, partial [Gemmataceae bacterium]|nr:ELWxxDGT repeat protein [Gemmataceae bacterium]